MCGGGRDGGSKHELRVWPVPLGNLLPMSMTVLVPGVCGLSRGVDNNVTVTVPTTRTMRFTYKVHITRGMRESTLYLCDWHIITVIILLVVGTNC